MIGDRSRSTPSGPRAVAGAVLLAAALSLGCGAAAAADRPARRHVWVPAQRPAPVLVHPGLAPNCYQGYSSYILSCAPQIGVPYDGVVASELSAPPPRVRQPYPSHYTFPYGGDAP